MKKYIKFLIFTALCFAVFTSNGQQNDTLKIERNKQGIVNFAHFKPNPERSIQDGAKFLKTFLHAKTDDDFRLIKETGDELGFSHLRFQQYYKGVKVENTEYLVHSRNGIIESINGDFKPVALSSVTPSLNEKQALQKALDYVHAKKYKWEDEAYEKFKRENTNDAAATYYPKGELVIVKDYLTGSKQMKLAWKFTISSLEPYNEQWVYIDAISGGVVGDTPLLLNSNTSGNAETLYSGTVGITCDSYSGGYRLYETRTTTPNHSVNIHTWNCQSQSNLTNAVEFSNNNNTNWTTGSWTAISQDQAALDAHWAAEKVLDYWRTVHNRNSLDNQGLAITGYVHFYEYNPSVGWPNNAAWDPNNHIMLYGDGDGGTNFYSLVALDVVAHEMGHGVAQYTAGFSSSNHRQECDALNEGFSDIWGACVEDWATSNKQTWLSGEEIVNPIYTCLRDMQNPNSLTAREGPHPDTYHGNFWDPNGEPHVNSTVLSHWFYLLSEGSNGYQTNDNTDCFYVSGIGITDAQKIAFRAETYLNSSATYVDARTQTILAASNLFGATSNQVVQTTNAWYGVGVGDEYQYQISGPSVVCSSGATFTVNNLPPGTTVFWNESANLTEDPNNPGTFTANGSGDGWVRAILTTGCGEITLPRKTVEVGNPERPGVSGSATLDCRQLMYYEADRRIVSWSVFGPLEIVGSNYGYKCTIKGTDTGGFYEDGWIYVTDENDCGSIRGELRVEVFCSLHYLVLSPNPATGETTLLIESESDEENKIDEGEWDLEIYNNSQMLTEKKTKLKGKEYKLNTSNWKDGVYTVRVKYKDEILTEKLVVTR